MGSNAIDGIKGITRGIADAAYGLATGKTKKIKFDELLAGHGSVPTPPVNHNGPTVWGWGFAQGSSGTASSTF